MSGLSYLQGVLNKYEVDISGAKAAGNIIYPVIQKWGGNVLLKAEFSGSISKGTAVKLATDADIFLSISSDCTSTLAQIYNTLCSEVSNAGYPVRKQNVSIGTTVSGHKIDLVPGKRQSQRGNDHSLYKRKTDSWTKTNISTHIEYVKKSGRIDEIKLAKIWRELHELEFPSFYLEMVVIDALKYSVQGDLPGNFLKVLDFFRDNLISARYIDPANTNNVISDDITAGQKNLIASQARQSRIQQNWQDIVW